MKKAIIAVMTTTLLSLGVWFYCYWFVAIGTHKFHEFKGGESINTVSGYVSANLYESEYPYRLTFFHYPRSKVTQPVEVRIEDVVLTGCETKKSYNYGSKSGAMEKIAIVSFEVKKEKGMKYEPYDVQATVRMIFEDGSEETQEFINHIRTNIRERDRIPRWHALWM